MGVNTKIMHALKDTTDHLADAIASSDNIFGAPRTVFQVVLVHLEKTLESTSHFPLEADNQEEFEDAEILYEEIRADLNNIRNILTDEEVDFADYLYRTTQIPSR